MKIVILKSSPHKDGASNTLAGFFTKGAEEAGHSICQLDVARMNIAPCLACDRGKNSGHCIVPDDIVKIEEALADADMVVYVTPVYCPTQGGVKPPPLGGGFSVSFVVCGHEQLS